MTRKRKITFLSALFAIILLCTALSPLISYAETPYKTYTLSGYGDVQETQTAYLAYETIVKFGDEAMKRPSDIYVTDDNEIYVADTGNGRIVVGNLQGDLIRIIDDPVLKSPRGVFVTENNKHVYVADRDAEAVFEFDHEGKLLNKYGKPTSPLYGDNLSFMPIKIVVNEAGIMFIICESNTNGIVEISPTEGGTFLGYFGTNFASADIRTIIYRVIMTEEQRAKMVSNIPSTPDNLAIDERGLIYTVTRGDEYKTLKRLNIAGINMIDRARYATIPAAVTAGNHENVYVADQNGYVYEYNNEGDLLYVFGGKDDGSQRIGLSTMVAAIDADPQDRLYLLDTDKAQIQVYTPTEFTNLLHRALYLYSKGMYTESKEPLEKVLQMNSMFDYANRAMGRAYFQEENYEMALQYARLAKDLDGYSDAYWEIRNQWLKRNITLMIILIAVIAVVWIVLSKLDKKRGIFNGVRKFWAKITGNRLMGNIKYARYYMMHPIDGSYGISREGHASWAASSILLAIFTIEFLVYKYLCGFLQKTVREGRYEVLSDIGMIAVVIFAVTVCNYLVCTINDGEGTPKKIYTYFCYSLMPYILLTPICFILSHVLTKNEQFLITLTQILMYGWTGILVIMGIKEVNNYTPKETIKIILLTLFTILIMALLVFIIYILWAQVFEFISAIFGEVVYRLGY